MGEGTRETLKHKRKKKGRAERNVSVSRGQHFELVACRQLLMLALMAWGGGNEGCSHERVIRELSRNNPCLSR